MQVDYAATLIYLEAKHGRDTLKNTMPDYQKQLDDVKKHSSSNVIENLASVAAWCADTNTEHMLLRLLDSRNDLPNHLDTD